MNYDAEIQKIEKLKSTMTEAEERVSYFKGMLAASKKDLKEKYGADTLEKAEELYDKLCSDQEVLENAIVALSRKIEKALEEQ